MMVVSELRKLKNGEYFTGTYLIKNSKVVTISKPYLDGIISDSTGELGFKIWNYSGNALPEGSVFDVTGSINIYNGKLGVIINSVSQSKVPKESLMVSSPLDLETLVKNIQEQIELIDDHVLYTLVNKIIEDNKNEFFTCPGAVLNHHNYLHGTAQHTLEVTILACSVMNTLIQLDGYNLNNSLTRSIALLHDIGKVDCYYMKNGVASMTDKGQFVDHICSGINIVMKTREELGIPEDDKMYLQLLHGIASHHGELEWGSPVKPKFTEALIVHMADNMSAKVAMMEEEIEEITDEWADKKSYMFGTKLYNSR